MPYDMRDPAFWDERQLDGELRRVFDLCHGCRLCFNLCPSFPALFDAIDDQTADESVGQLTTEQIERVVDYCFGCQVCYVKCPYTPPHPYAVDFPRLMLRARAVRAAQRGIPLADRLLSDPDLVGSGARLAAPLVNWANRNPVLRRVAEAVVGVHRERNLPEFHSQTFGQWLRRHGVSRAPDASAEPAGKAALFHTCFVEYNEPAVGRAAVEVLARNGVAVESPDQKCCGMPAMGVGDLDRAREHAYFNIAALKPYVDAGCAIVVPNPTCSHMLKSEYPLLVDTPESRAVAAATRDLCEYLMELHAAGRLSCEFQSSPGTVAYHLPCHLRVQDIGSPGRDLMQLVPDTQVTRIEECSGHGGAWSMKTDFYEPSLKVGRKLFRKITDAEPNVVATDCPLAALQIERGCSRRALHPVQVLHMAYEGQSFDG